MGTVAITGAAGYIGQKLIGRLEEADWCDRILGTDVRQPGVVSGKLDFLKADIRDHSLADFLKGREVSALVHLAFIVDPIHDEDEMYDINVGGTLNVLKTCEELEIGHVIVASSGVAYGAWPDNPEPLKEDDPIRLFPPSLNYAHHKGLNEGHFADFMKRNPAVIFNAVRPAIVYGPKTDNYLSRFFRKLPVAPLMDGRDPDMQFVHEDDVARFFEVLIEKRVPGPFNLAGNGVVRLSEAGAMIGRRSLSVPKGLMDAFARLCWRLHIVLEAPPGIVDYMTYPWVLDISRARDLLGFTPRYSTRETIRIMFETHGYKVSQAEIGGHHT